MTNKIPQNDPELTKAKNELNKLIRNFCKENGIMKSGKNYTFKLGATTYRVSNHKIQLTGTKNNYTRYEPFKDSNKPKPSLVYIYDNEDNIITIYNELKKEHLDKLNKLLNKQGKDDV